MSRFRDELRIISGIAWVIAGLSFVFVEVLMWQLAFPGDSDLRNGPFIVRVCISTLAASVVAAYVLLVGYVSGDAQRRGNKRAWWQRVVSFMILVLQLLMLVALVCCASRIISEAAEWFFFDRQATQNHDDFIA